MHLSYLTHWLKRPAFVHGNVGIDQTTAASVEEPHSVCERGSQQRHDWCSVVLLRRWCLIGLQWKISQNIPYLEGYFHKALKGSSSLFMWPITVALNVWCIKMNLNWDLYSVVFCTVNLSPKTDFISNCIADLIGKYKQYQFPMAIWGLFSPCTSS